MRSSSHNKGLSALHAETWCLGNRVYTGGSFNFTKNADVSNEERLVVINNEDVVTTHERWFYDLWERAAAVTAEVITLLRQRKSESQKASVPRGGRAARSAVPEVAAAAAELLALPAVPESRSPVSSVRGRRPSDLGCRWCRSAAHRLSIRNEAAGVSAAGGFCEPY